MSTRSLRSGPWSRASQSGWCLRCAVLLQLICCWSQCEWLHLWMFTVVSAPWTGHLRRRDGQAALLGCHSRLQARGVAHLYSYVSGARACVADVSGCPTMEVLLLQHCARVLTAGLRHVSCLQQCCAPCLQVLNCIDYLHKFGYSKEQVSACPSQPYGVQGTAPVDTPTRHCRAFGTKGIRWHRPRCAGVAQLCIANFQVQLQIQMPQVYLLLSCCPAEGRISGIVDAPNACATLAIPLAIFDQVRCRLVVAPLFLLAPLIRSRSDARAAPAFSQGACLLLSAA